MPTTAELDQLIRAQAETIAALTARIQSLEDAQRPSSTSSLESTLSTLAAIHTDQQVILKDVLVQTNTITALLTSPPDHSTLTKPLSTEPNALHSLIFPGPTIQSDSIKDIIDTFRKLKLIQQKSKNSSDSYIFDYFRLHAPDMFGCLLAKYRIHFSAPHFQFHSPDSDFMTDVYSALFPTPTTPLFPILPSQLFSSYTTIKPDIPLSISKTCISDKLSIFRLVPYDNHCAQPTIPRPLPWPTFLTSFIEFSLQPLPWPNILISFLELCRLPLKSQFCLLSHASSL